MPAGGTLLWCRQEVSAQTVGVAPSVSLTLDSSLTEGAKDEELLLVNVSEKVINHRYKEGS